MSKSSILAILASVGITVVGPVTQDTEAFARAVLSNNDAQLLRFAQQFPESSYRNDAIRLACVTNWVNGACGADSDVKGLNQGNTPPGGYGDAA